MKTLNDQISNLNLQELTVKESGDINAGSWLTDAADFVGFAIGFTAHAVIDAVLLVTGNFGPHNPK